MSCTVVLLSFVCVLNRELALFTYIAVSYLINLLLENLLFCPVYDRMPSVSSLLLFADIDKLTELMDKIFLDAGYYRISMFDNHHWCSFDRIVT